MTPLQRRLLDAVTDGDLAGVQAALKAGASPTANYVSVLAVAAERGYLDIVKYLLAAGAPVHAWVDMALRTAAAEGHTSVVQCLLEAGADVRACRGEALDSAARNGHAPVVRLLREHRATFSRVGIELFSHAVQVALLSAGGVGDLSVTALARAKVCPDALCALLHQQGHTALAAMISATQMLEPMDPAARAELLGDMLAKYHPEQPAWKGP